MSIALRMSSFLCLVRRALSELPMVYLALGLVACVSVGCAIIQACGWPLWATYNDRPTGLFFSPIAQGGFLGLMIVAMIRINFWMLVPTLMIGLYLAHNRGGWVVVVVGLLAHWIRQPLVILSTILSGALYLSINPSPSDIERFNIWEAGWLNLSWLGHGWGSYSDVWIVREGLGYQPLHAHNDFLEFAFEFGLYSIPLFGVLAYALTQSKSPDWPILVAFCVLATFAMPLYIPATAGIGAVALALTLGERNG